MKEYENAPDATEAVTISNKGKVEKVDPTVLRMNERKITALIQYKNRIDKNIVTASKEKYINCCIIIAPCKPQTLWHVT